MSDVPDTFRVFGRNVDGLEEMKGGRTHFLAVAKIPGEERS